MIWSLGELFEASQIFRGLGLLFFFDAFGHLLLTVTFADGAGFCIADDLKSLMVFSSTFIASGVRIVSLDAWVSFCAESSCKSTLARGVPAYVSLLVKVYTSTSLEICKVF